MPSVWLFDIESHEQRYTKEWETFLPAQLQRFNATQRTKPRKNIVSLSGGRTSRATSPGAFLHFAETNVYKSTQVANFSMSVRKGAVKRGDRVFFADAWHPGVIQSRYMSDLLDLDLRIFVLFHAGSYDPHDFLGRKVTNKLWSMGFERAVYDAADVSFFATNFHQAMFHRTLDVRMSIKSQVAGWPMEYLGGLLKPHQQTPKQNIIVIPHRMSPEKQPEIGKMLVEGLPDFEIVFAQETSLNKAQYHALLGRAAAVFSANLQETLGIGVFEGLLCGAVPIVPDRLSYSEMYPGLCYPSVWTETPELAAHHLPDICRFIRNRIAQADLLQLEFLAASVQRKFFNGSELYAQVLR